jgi:hypothetical protein
MLKEVFWWEDKLTTTHNSYFKQKLIRDSSRPNSRRASLTMIMMIAIALKHGIRHWHADGKTSQNKSFHDSIPAVFAQQASLKSCCLFTVTRLVPAYVHPLGYSWAKVSGDENTSFHSIHRNCWCVIGAPTSIYVNLVHGSFPSYLNNVLVPTM